MAVGGTLNLPHEVTTGPNASSLPIATLGQILASSGFNYQIAYKGKWHLTDGFQTSLSPTQQQQMASALAADDYDMLSVYGFPGWTSPDFGTYMDTRSNNFTGVYTLGGGLGGNDARITNGTSYSEITETNSLEGPTGEVVIVENAVQFLQNQSPNSTNPFCLIVSLLNPHDVFVSPYLYQQAGYCSESGDEPWRVAPFTDIQLPPNYTLSQEQLDAKPAAQWNWQFNAFGAKLNEDQALDYLRFYAYLETLTDAMLGEVMAAMCAEVATNTLVVRLSDHGEMGMSQGGMREKEENVYKETLLVPMIFSNPGLSQGAECRGLAGLIDIVPTLAEICGIADLSSTYAVQGKSLAGAILKPDSTETYHRFLFATDDTTDSAIPIRCLVEDRDYHVKYAVYYDKAEMPDNPNGYSSNWQCELYHFNSDPTARDSEMTNHIPPNGLQTQEHATSNWAQWTWHVMHKHLTDAMYETNTLPANWPPPPPPPLPSDSE